MMSSVVALNLADRQIQSRGRGLSALTSYPSHNLHLIAIGIISIKHRNGRQACEVWEEQTQRWRRQGTFDQVLPSVALSPVNPDAVLLDRALPLLTRGKTLPKRTISSGKPRGRPRRSPTPPPRIRRPVAPTPEIGSPLPPLSQRRLPRRSSSVSLGAARPLLPVPFAWEGLGEWP